MITPTNGRERGIIYTFYSFKGGVGRSMALANSAALLAKWGYSVLAVDFDLEAPGLERFFARANPTINATRAEKAGIIDLIEAKAGGNPFDWHECLIDVQVGSNSSRLSLLTAGRGSEDYNSRLHRLDFPRLFDEKDLGVYIEDLRDQWASEFQFVLVDSRTGVTDIGGICTVHLADVLVLLFTTTDSSAHGALDILKRARDAQQHLPLDRGRLLAIPVPARDESRTEYERAAEWKQRFAEDFAEAYIDWLPSGIKPRDAIELLRIPYVPYWSFGEQLPAIEEGTTDPASLGHAYEILARLLGTRLDWYKALEGQEMAPPPLAKPHEPDPDWLTKHRFSAMERLLASRLPGYMDLLHFCRDVSIEKAQPDLLSAMRQAQVALTGWPLGLVLDREEFRPTSATDGIVAVVNAHLPAPARHSLDYWALSKWGDFYTLRSLSENKLDKDRAEKIIWFDVRILRAAEALLHCANLHKALGTDPNSQIELSVRYGGLLGRQLTSVSPMWSYHGTNIHDDQVRIGPTTFRLRDVDSGLVPLVKRLCAPLFVIFDFVEIPDDVYEKIVTDFICGRGAALIW